MKTALSFGETLWDLLPSGPPLGGAPFNLAYRVNSLGERGVIVTRLGRHAFDQAKAQGMETGFIQWGDPHATGTVPVQVDAKGVPDFGILKDVAYDYIEPSGELLDLASRAECICFGSLCRRSAISQRALLSLLSAVAKALEVFDIDLRKDCCSKAVVERSIFKADILKLNDGEALELGRMCELPQKTAEGIAAEALNRWV